MWASFARDRAPVSFPLQHLSLFSSPFFVLLFLFSLFSLFFFPSPGIPRSRRRRAAQVNYATAVARLALASGAGVPADSDKRLNSPSLGVLLLVRRSPFNMSLRIHVIAHLTTSFCRPHFFSLFFFSHDPNVAMREQPARGSRELSTRLVEPPPDLICSTDGHGWPHL